MRSSACAACSAYQATCACSLVVERMRVREEQAERAEPVAAAAHERRRVERVRGAAQRLWTPGSVARSVASSPITIARAGVVRERRGLRDHELARGRARRERAVGRGRELEAVMILGLERDDAERSGEGVGEPGDEAVRDLAAERGAAEDARQVAPLALAAALALGLAAAAQEHERDQEEHDRGGGGDQRELEEEAAARIRRRAPSAAGRSTIVQPGIADVL